MTYRPRVKASLAGISAVALLSCLVASSAASTVAEAKPACVAKGPKWVAHPAHGGAPIKRGHVLRQDDVDGRQTSHVRMG